MGRARRADHRGNVAAAGWGAVADRAPRARDRYVYAPAEGVFRTRARLDLDTGSGTVLRTWS